MRARPVTLAGRILAFNALGDQEKKILTAQAAYENSVLMNGQDSRETHDIEKYISALKNPNTAILLDGRYFDAALESAKFFAKELSLSARFNLHFSVVEQMMRMVDTVPTDKILDHFEKATPPFRKTWFEYSQDQHDERLNLSYKAQVGFMVEHRKEGGISIRRLSYVDKIPSAPMFPDPNSITLISKNAVTAQPSDFITQDQSDIKGLEKRMVLGGKIALCAFLLMNSRSKVIQAGPEVRARGKLGYVEPVGLRPITFDLSRIIKSRPGISQEEAERILAEQMVRGHFKVRKTGVFFWSPHVRNVEPGSTPEEAWDRQLTRDRVDTIHHPDRPLVLPSGTKPPGL